jgi:hypothetical protein
MARSGSARGARCEDGRSCNGDTDLGVTSQRMMSVGIELGIAPNLLKGFAMGDRMHYGPAQRAIRNSRRNPAVNSCQNRNQLYQTHPDEGHVPPCKTRTGPPRRPVGHPPVHGAASTCLRVGGWARRSKSCKVHVKRRTRPLHRPWRTLRRTPGALRRQTPYAGPLRRRSCAGSLRRRRRSAAPAPAHARFSSHDFPRRRCVHLRLFCNCISYPPGQSIAVGAPRYPQCTSIVDTPKTKRRRAILSDGTLQTNPTKPPLRVSSELTATSRRGSARRPPASDGGRRRAAPCCPA